MNIRQRQLLIAMLNDCFNSISDHDDHNGDWRRLADDEDAALQQACRDVLFSGYAERAIPADWVEQLAFQILINGYQECAA